MKKQALLLIITFVFILSLCGAVTAANGTTERVSISSTGEEGDSSSSEPSISADGRYAAFASDATNLVNGDNNGFTDIFVYDRVLNVTERVSVSSSGEEANSNSFEPSISGDGRYVAFVSISTNLVANDTNGYADIFVHDRLLKVTERISIAIDGEQGNSSSSEPSISADGRCVAFSSLASNLVLNDTNNWGDVFVYDRISGTTERVSISTSGEEQLMPANSLIYDDYEPSISADGRYVAFSSWASNLVSDDNNNSKDVFIRDRLLKVTERASISSTGEEANAGGSEPSISADGRYVAFSSGATDLAVNDNNPWSDIFVHDRQTGITERISTFSSGEETISHNPSISADGRYVAFRSIKAEIGGLANLSLQRISDRNYIGKYGFNKNYNLFATDLVTKYDNVFVHDQTLKITECISISCTGEESDAISHEPSISADGRCVAFSSLASNLVLDDNNKFKDVFVYDSNKIMQVLASLNPSILKSGKSFQIKAVPDPNIENITASIFGENYNLIKEADITWSLIYIVPQISDGVYSVLLTATELSGIQHTVSLSFTVDNTAPVVFGSISPNPPIMCHNEFGFPIGRNITIEALCDDPEIELVTVYIFGYTFDMIKQPNGSWKFEYTVWESDGVYPVILTATDEAGNQGSTTLDLIVDNTPPTVVANISHNVIKSGDLVGVNASSDSDTKSIIAEILTGNFDFIKTAELIKKIDGTWGLEFIFPDISDGNYLVRLVAKDWAENRGFVDIYFIVDNTPPQVSGTINPKLLRSGDMLTIRPSTKNFTPYDTVKVTVSILGETFDATKISDGYLGYGWTSEWYSSYTVPKIPDGTYNVLITASDIAGNKDIFSLDFTVDNTPPVITATVIPDTLKFVDFSGQRKIKITAESSSDTKAVNAFLDGYSPSFTYSNGYWILEVGVPHIITIGSHNIKLIVIDNAGNEGTGYVSYSVVDFSGSSNPPSGWSGFETHRGSSGSSSGTEGSTEGGEGESTTNPGGSSGGSEGETPNPSGSTTYPDYTALLILILLVILLLMLVILYPFILEMILILLLRGFIALIHIIMRCLLYLGWVFLESGLLINPFSFVLELFSFYCAPSIPSALQLIIRLLGGRFSSFAPIAQIIEDGLYSYGIYEFAENTFKLGERFKEWLGRK